MAGNMYSLGFFTALAIGGGAYYLGLTSLQERRLSNSPESMRVRLPVVGQVLSAFGDRYLAANITTLRATVLGTQRQDPVTYQVLGGIQSDAAFLNPAQEDNYYLASAVLPWEGEVAASQHVLRLATDGRPTDPYPPFYYGFNQQYFLRDYIGAARAAEVAAARVDGGARLSLLNIASKWYERHEDPELAERTITSLINSTRDPQLRERLQLRIKRIRLHTELRGAVSRYREQTGRSPANLDELVAAGIIRNIPPDPLGEGFRMKGDDVVINRPSAR